MTVQETTKPTFPVIGRPRTVLVVDDHRSFADLLAMALSAEPDLVCVGTAVGAAQGLAMADELRPDVVVMDIEMPQQNGIAATWSLRERVPRTAVVVVTAHRDPQWMVRAAQAGAAAFVPKDGSLDEMLVALRTARPGNLVVAPSAFRADRSAGAVAADAPALTPRERDVLVHLAQGIAPKAIARLLNISVHTCRGYVKSLLSKLGVRSQLEAVVRAQELGLVPPRGA
ncbi:response regulator transcription factor [Pseudonocardia alni]|uniref:response regulator transcription factor n=1 Tax=Pseudonocardia alni TaxID=33907 RepID=UPI0033188F0B